MVTTLRLSHGKAGLLLVAFAVVGASHKSVVGQSSPIPYRVSETPTVMIRGSGPDGSVRFANAVHAAVLADGAIAVVDLTDHGVVVFDALGRLQRRIGRVGQGPGEYQYPSWAAACGTDSLFVWDAVLRRIAVHAPNGAFARQFRFGRSPSKVTCSSTTLFAYIVPEGTLGRPGVDSPVYQGIVTIASAAGDSIGSIGRVPIGQNRPLATISQFAQCRDQVVFGSAETPAITLYGVDGTKRDSFLLEGERRRPAPTHYERAIDALAGAITNVGERPAIRDYFRRIPMPEFLPRFSRIHCDPHGGIWVQTSVPGDPYAEFLVYVLGRKVATVRLPSDQVLTDVGADMLVTLQTTADGGQIVAGYRYAR